MKNLFTYKEEPTTNGFEYVCYNCDRCIGIIYFDTNKDVEYVNYYKYTTIEEQNYIRKMINMQGR